jgi:ABC-2 type transport system ATP-binding protein
MADLPERTPAIALVGLTKRFGRLMAADHLSLEVAQGEIFGFLGANGAGKTTAIRVLLDLLRPSSGRAFVLGSDCQRRGLAARAHIGYLPGEFDVPEDMTGQAVLNLLARLGAAPIDPAYHRQLQSRLGLATTDLGRKVREYSTGMKRRLGILQAFQSNPEVLILDEPTEGLDPAMQEGFYELLEDVRRRGRTVFMSSHVLSEVERVCQRIAVLKAGRLGLLSTVDEVRRLAARRVKVVFAEDVAAPEPGRLPVDYEVLEVAPRLWTLRVRGPLGPMIPALSGLPVEDVDVREPHLEDVLIQYYRES